MPITSPQKLQQIAEQASFIAKEMANKLLKYNHKTAALLYTELPTELLQPMVLHGGEDDKHHSIEAKNKRVAEYLEGIRNPEKYPLETRVAEVEEMKKIIATYTQKIKDLYANAMVAD